MVLYYFSLSLPPGIQLLLGSLGHPAITVLLDWLWLPKVCISDKGSWKVPWNRKKGPFPCGYLESTDGDVCLGVTLHKHYFLKHCGCDILYMLHKIDYRLQIVNIQIDVLLTWSTTFTLTPPQQLFNVETHETTKKIMTSAQFHGTTLLLNIIIHHLNTHKWKNISCTLKSSTHFFYCNV